MKHFVVFALSGRLIGMFNTREQANAGIARYLAASNEYNPVGAEGQLITTDYMLLFEVVPEDAWKVPTVKRCGCTDCDAAATHVVAWGKGPEDFMYTCDEHVAQAIKAGVSTTVYPVDQAPKWM